MLTIIATAGRVLLWHWPALLAWFAAGTLGHYLAIQLAGYVGAWSSTGGFLILPLAILAKLISFVAMFLVVRDGLSNLRTIAPSPVDPVERRRTFLTTLLASILPFFAIYAAWGFLKDDVTAYATRALEERTAITWTQLSEQVDEGNLGSALPELPADAVLSLSFNVGTIAVIVLAFAGRWAWKRHSSSLPKVLSLFAVYLEAVWVCFSIFLISDGISAITGWVDSRAALVWIDDLREWLSTQLGVVAWIWGGVEWVLGEAGGILLQPLAWLAVAGVIYGQAIAVDGVLPRHRLLARAILPLERLPRPVSRWLGGLGEEFVGRFRPIVRAIELMWRAGPVLIATYVFLYTVVLAMDALLSLALTRLIGPHDLGTFWRVADGVIFLLVPMIVEPVRFVLVSAAYDSTLRALREQVREGTGAVAPAAITSETQRLLDPNSPDGVQGANEN